MVITGSPLPQDNSNLTLSFFVVIPQFFSWVIFINDCICILTGSPGYLFHDCTCYTKIGGSKISPKILNAMVNYNYHGENRAITRLLQSAEHKIIYIKIIYYVL